MTQLDDLPTLVAFGEQLATRAERDAARPSPLGRPPALASTRRLALAGVLVAAVAVAVVSAVVPPTRAAVEDVFSALDGWIDGADTGAPGRPVAGDENVPPWVAAEDGAKRVLAQAGGEKLIAIRQGDKLTLALAGSAQTGTIADYRQALGDRKIVLAGIGRFVPGTHHQRRPIFGLLTSSITRVEFSYLDGRRPIRVDHLDGAFGITIETNRRPAALTGYDHSGKRIANLDLRSPTRGDFGFRYCTARGCQAWQP